MKNLGDQIKEARKSLRLTQWKVAEAMKVERTTVSNWECGRAEPDLRTLRELSKVLQYDLLREHAEITVDQEEKARKSRLKLTDAPLIEVVASEYANIFASGSVDLHVNGRDAHGNPVNIHISANFCVENDSE